MQTFYSFALYTFFVISIVFSTSTHAVVGGEPTSQTTHKSIVNIKFERTVCSGVLIGPHTILTAAHCGNKGKAPMLVAYIQAGIQTKECNIQPVVSFEYHPNAELSAVKVFYPDLMILEIEQPLCGATPSEILSEAPAEGEVVHLAGHGRWEFGHAISTQISAEIINFSDVRSHIEVSKNFDKKMVNRFFSAGAESYTYALPKESQASICPGDSGGPVFFESEEVLQLVGINGAVLGNEKLGAKKCNYAYVQAFTPVRPHLEWISSKMFDIETRALNSSHANPQKNVLD